MRTLKRGDVLMLLVAIALIACGGLSYFSWTPTTNALTSSSGSVDALSLYRARRNHNGLRQRRAEV
jgi:hypothetical protein